MRLFLAAILFASFPVVANATRDLPRRADWTSTYAHGEVQPVVWGETIAGRHENRVFRLDFSHGTPLVQGMRSFHPDIHDGYLAFLEADEVGHTRPRVIWGKGEIDVGDWGVWRYPRIWSEGAVIRVVVEKQEQYATGIDWDVRWYLFHDDVSPPETFTIGDSNRDQLEPAVWNGVVAYVEHARPGPLGYEVVVVNEVDFGKRTVLGPGRYPDVNVNGEVVFEHVSRGSSTIHVDGKQLWKMPPDCEGYHRPKWGGDRFVLFSGSGCLKNTGISARMLFLADRATGCTWRVDSLTTPALHGNMIDTWIEENEPVAYDIDESGNIVLSKWVGPGWLDFAMIYIVPDIGELNSCKP